MKHPLSMSKDDLASAFGAIAVEAGQIILKARALGCGAEAKADGSPVTAAELESDRLIRARLSAIVPAIGAITGEPFGDRSSQRDVDGLQNFVLVDPLD